MILVDQLAGSFRLASPKEGDKKETVGGVVGLCVCATLSSLLPKETMTCL